MIEVIDYTRDDIVWPFDGTPYMRIGRSLWGEKVNVDPTPAYGHERSLAEHTAAGCCAAFPIDWPVSICLLPVEDLSRTNGATTCAGNYDYDSPAEPDGSYQAHPIATISFSAKRIPVHPAMTRYLVSHEYGHAVEEWLNMREGGKLGDGKLMKCYAELRGMASPAAYGDGLWHLTPSEVFANDFRILVCRVESEFWPHPGIERPESNQVICDWWAARVQEAAALGRSTQP